MTRDETISRPSRRVGDGSRDLQMSVRALITGLFLLLPLGAQQPNIQYAQNFPGSDIGAQIDAAYIALPASGGQIIVTQSASFATPISFTTPNKPVLLT